MLTHTRTIDPTQYKDHIQQARHEILTGWNASTDRQFLEPLPHGRYLGMFSRPHDHLIGFSEWYRYSNLPNGLESSPYGKAIDLPAIGTAEEIANIRTIYIKDEYRKSFGTYIKLYVSTAFSAMEHGIRFTTLSTATTARQLQSLYRSMGGQLLGYVSIQSFAINLAVFLMKLDQLVTSPVAQRVMTRT